MAAVFFCREFVFPDVKTFTGISLMSLYAGDSCKNTHKKTLLQLNSTSPFTWYFYKLFKGLDSNFEVKSSNFKSCYKRNNYLALNNMGQRLETIITMTYNLTDMIFNDSFNLNTCMCLDRLAINAISCF